MRATRRSAANILARQKELGLLADDVELSPINPHGEPGVTGPDGQPWPQLDFVRPWDSLSDDERRLFARMAEVFAGFVSYTDAQIGRFIDYLEAVRAAREHHHRGRVRQRLQRRRRAQRLVQREQVLQQRAGHDRGQPGAPRRPGQHDLLQPLQHRLGVGVRHAVPVLEALCRLRGRRRRPADRLLAGRHRRARRGAPSVHARGRHRPDALRGARRRAARRPQGLHAEPDRGRELRRVVRRSGRLRPRDASSTRCSACARSTTRAGSPRRCTRRSRAGATSSDDVWELYDLRSDRSQIHNVAAEHPDRLEQLKGLWFYYAGVYKGLPLDDRTALEIISSPRPAARASRAAATCYYPGNADVPESVAVEHPPALVHDRRRRDDRRAPTPQGVLFAHGGVAGGHASTSRTATLHYVYNWLGERLQNDHLRDADPARPARADRRVRQDRRRGGTR